MEIVSGQWIYVRCISQVSDPDAPPKGSLEASYIQDTTTRITETVKIDGDELIFVPDT